MADSDELLNGAPQLLAIVRIGVVRLPLDDVCGPACGNGNPFTAWQEEWFGKDIAADDRVNRLIVGTISAYPLYQVAQ